MNLHSRLARLEQCRSEAGRCRPGACQLPMIAHLTELPDGQLIDDETGNPTTLPGRPTCARCGRVSGEIGVIVTVMPSPSAGGVPADLPIE